MNRRIFTVFAICAMSAVCLCLSTPAFAQYRTAIQGAVTDQTGAVIPGATLTLKNLSTNETFTRTSSGDGVFNFNALPADHFSLTVEASGFQKKVLDNLQLIPEQSNAVNVQLDAGTASTTITVDASQTPAIDTQTATTGRTISDREIEHIPVYQRDPTSLIRLVPGVLADGAQQGGVRRPSGEPGAAGGGREVAGQHLVVL